MILLLDDNERENEGDLIALARHITPRAINFMATEARGLICLALSPAWCDRLRLTQMVPASENTSPHHTQFTVSVEARRGVTTGISAADRAHTIRTAVSPAAVAEDLARPGHIFPIRGHADGLRGRRGHTEGALELSLRAGDKPAAAVMVEVMHADGTMARKADLEKFSARHKIRMGSVASLVK